MTVRNLEADASEASRVSAAFLQGEFPGATSPKGPIAQVGAAFELPENDDATG